MLSKLNALAVAGAGEIEPCHNPLPHKAFSIPARPFDSIFQKALVGMTDHEAAYIEAKGWKTIVVPEPSIIHHFANFCASNVGALRSAMRDADFLQNLHLCPLLAVMRTRLAQPELFRVSPMTVEKVFCIAERKLASDFGNWPEGISGTHDAAELRQASRRRQNG